MISRFWWGMVLGIITSVGLMFAGMPPLICGFVGALVSILIWDA